MSNFKFRVGGYYWHEDGAMMHIVAEVETTRYGKILLAETNDMVKEFIAVRDDKKGQEKWHEASKNKWMQDFCDPSEVKVSDDSPIIIPGKKPTIIPPVGQKH